MPKNKTVKRARIQSTATEDAFSACEILVEAYRLGDGFGSIPWENLDEAHREAKRALRKRRRELGALSAPRLQLADSKGVLRPCRIILS